ncbi:hypothetical protein [Leclercia adecarboxylata]|uniref:hypothetical protein n=1 Tax=Leclercia adecarboxylata TaxID=83655 RepID=UPI001D0FD953|nr:hypothetical protein [Leclercia adecarboxylata]
MAQSCRTHRYRQRISLPMARHQQTAKCRLHPHCLMKRPQKIRRRLTLRRQKAQRNAYPECHPGSDAAGCYSWQQPDGRESAVDYPNRCAGAGNTDFLNGRWHAGAGIQDQRTGKPLSLNYQINDGKGEVQMVRGDGVTCRGAVNAPSSQASGDQ